MLGSNACWPAEVMGNCCGLNCLCCKIQALPLWDGKPPAQYPLETNEHEYYCILASWLKREVYSMLPWKKLLHGCSKHAFKYAKWSPPNLNQWFISKTLPSNQTGKTLLETQPPWCLLQRGFLIRTSSPVTRTSLRCAKRWVLRKVNDKFVKRPNRIATMELPARSCFHHSRPTSRQFGTFGNV